MSSMRNAVQRRNHKERAQPHEREKWGILEKHKDYSKRARDYNEKKARLKILRQKAAERNPDEFYFGMIHGKTHDKGRKLADRGNKVLSHAAVTLLKTQDAGYIRTMLQQTRKERERLEQQAILGDQQSEESKQAAAHKREQGRKLVFVDTLPPQAAPPVLKVLDPEEDDKGDSQENQSLQTAEESQRKKAQATRMSKLAALREREAALAEADQELDLQRARMSNNLGGVNKNGIRWKHKGRKK